MKILGKISATLFFVYVLPFAGFAQDPTPAMDTPGATGPMRLDVVVTPSSGTPVPDLPQSVFTVLDNGKPQPIQSFRAVDGDASVKVLMVADAVNIDFTRLAYERQQLENFFRANEGKLAEPTSLAIVTDTSTESTNGFTTDGNALLQALDNKDTGLRELRRSAGFYGAEDRLDVSLRAFQNILAHAATIPGRKIIVWISPGWPLLSGPAVQLTSKQADGIFREVVSTSAQMRAANVVLYSVDPLGAGQGPGRTFYYEDFLKGVRNPGQVLPGDLGLQVLATQSGGLALNSSNDVAALIQRCVNDVKAFYEISYMPPPGDKPNEYHKVEVKIAEPHLIAHTRQGYYSHP